MEQLLIYMKSLAICCVLLCICTCSQAQIIETTPPVESTTPLILEPISTEPIESIDVTLTPPEISTDVLPDPDVYPITVRIVIEVQPIIVTQNGQKMESLWIARSLDEVRRDLQLTEEVYKDVAIRLVTVEIVYKEYKSDVTRHMLEAMSRSGTLTITYMLPNAFPWDGHSSPPWEPINRGIVLSYLSDKWTLAHELGHYFGLEHTFADHLEDTPEQTQKYCTGKEFSTSNCHNIMNYCEHDGKFITCEQLDRFKRFLRHDKIDHLDRERTDILLRGHKFNILPTNDPILEQNP